MKSKIIGQGYNLEENTSVAKELIELFNSDKYDKFTCLVAFASYGGITALTPHILRAKTEVYIQRGFGKSAFLGCGFIHLLYSEY